jgi:hypothetical protein
MFEPIEICWAPQRLPLVLHHALVATRPRLTQVELMGHTPTSSATHPPPPLAIPVALARIGSVAWPLDNGYWLHTQLVAEALKTGTALGVADGLYMPNHSKAHGAASLAVTGSCGFTALLRKRTSRARHITPIVRQFVNQRGHELRIRQERTQVERAESYVDAQPVIGIVS